MTKSVLFLSLALAGCTTASTRMLTDDTARISARDLSTGSASAVRKKALITAANEAKARGFDHFEVISLQDTIKPNPQTLSNGPIGSGGPHSSGGVMFQDLSTDITVRFLRRGQLPEDRRAIYDASSFASSI